MRKYKHWLRYDTIRTEQVKKTLSKGTGFDIIRFYPHPSKFGTMVIELESNQNYQDLDLDVNGGGSYLYTYKQKPNNLGKGISIQQFESVYGEIPKVDTFYEAYNNNKVSLEDIDNYIEQWHEGSSKLPIYEYLGLSQDQYRLWVETSNL
jgi:hypothetical protein